MSDSKLDQFQNRGCITCPRKEDKNIPITTLGEGSEFVLSCPDLQVGETEIGEINCSQNKLPCPIYAQVKKILKANR